MLISEASVWWLGLAMVWPFLPKTNCQFSCVLDWFTESLTICLLASRFVVYLLFLNKVVYLFVSVCLSVYIYLSMSCYIISIYIRIILIPHMWINLAIIWHVIFVNYKYSVNSNSNWSFSDFLQKIYQDLISK